MNVGISMNDVRTAESAMSDSLVCLVGWYFFCLVEGNGENVRDGWFRGKNLLIICLLLCREQTASESHNE